MIALSQILTGRTEEHLVEFRSSGVKLHREVAEPLGRLADAAAAAGFELKIVSAFRGFAAQLRIWNEKALGKRPVLDSRSRPLDPTQLPKLDLALAILRWSALPGGSRHHWGTDLDVVDAKAMPEGYRVQLVPEEVEPGGIFGPFHDWLDGALDRYGFFRPYREDRGGVAPERWHLSYAPVADRYLASLDRAVLEEAIRESDMELKQTVLENLDMIERRFVRNISPYLSR